MNDRKDFLETVYVPQTKQKHALIKYCLTKIDGCFFFKYLPNHPFTPAQAHPLDSERT